MSKIRTRNSFQASPPLDMFVERPNGERELSAGAIDAAREAATRVFTKIASDLGNDIAKGILAELYRDYVEEMGKREIEEEQNRYLLEMYDLYKLPVQTLAKKLAGLNELFPFPVFGIRGGHSEAAIRRQLGRLLQGRPGPRWGKRPRDPELEASRRTLLALCKKHRPR